MNNQYNLYNAKIKIDPENQVLFSDAKLVKLIFQEPIIEHQSLNIRFTYKGYLNIVSPYGVNRLTKDWIEVGIYTPWFPLYGDC